MNAVKFSFTCILYENPLNHLVAWDFMYSAWQSCKDRLSILAGIESQMFLGEYS